MLGDNKEQRISTLCSSCELCHLLLFVEPDNCQDCSNDITEKLDEEEVMRGGPRDVMLGVKTAQMMTWDDMLIWSHLVPIASYVTGSTVAKYFIHG